MTRPRDRRLKPDPPTPEEEAEIEAKYVLLIEWVERMRAERAEREERRGGDQWTTSDATDSSPFLLDGGRVGDGGVAQAPGGGR